MLFFIHRKVWRRRILLLQQTLYEENLKLDTIPVYALSLHVKVEEHARNTSIISKVLVRMRKGAISRAFGRWKSYLDEVLDARACLCAVVGRYVCVCVCVCVW